jgi:oligopeptide transport system permease protein
MTAFLVRRLVGGVLTLFAIATLSFFICRFAPGSPFTSEKNVPPEVRRNMERKYGFDKPLITQYAIVLGGYLRGDLGPSYQYIGRDVSEFVWPGFKVSVRLGAITFVLAMTFGVAFGVIAAARQNRWPDHVSMTAATMGICVPNFLLGPLLVIVFHYWLRWFDPTGWPESWFQPSELKKVILPAVTLSMVHIAYLSRLTRAGMLDVLHKDFIRTARAKGLSEASVFLKHALKNGITPALSYSGPMAAFVITGSIVVEKIFAIPGLGTHFVNSASNRDYGLVMGTILVYSTLVIFFNFLVDLAYGFLDPRVRVS